MKASFHCTRLRYLCTTKFSHKQNHGKSFGKAAVGHCLPVDGDGTFQFHRLSDGCGPHAQHHHAHGPRPVAQHGVLLDGYLRIDGCHRQVVRRVRCCRPAGNDSPPIDAAFVQPAGRGIAGSRDDFPLRQPRHHLIVEGQTVQFLLQEIPVYLAHQLRNSLWHGAHCHRLHGGSRLFRRTDGGTFRGRLWLYRFNSVHAAFRRKGLSGLRGGECEWQRQRA